MIVKSPNTVCRLEERKHPTAEKPAIEFVNDIFNPSDRFERKFAEQDKKLNEVNDNLKRLIVAVTRGSNYDMNRRGI